MAEYNFQLRGWPAIAVIAAMLGFFGIRAYLRVRSVNDAMRDAVRAELLKEYSGRGMSDFARLVREAREGLPIESAPALVQRDVEFTSIGAHGRIGGPVTFVRAEVTVDGGQPPDGRPVRYFLVSRALDGGWTVLDERSSYRYYAEMLP